MSGQALFGKQTMEIRHISKLGPRHGSGIHHPFHRPMLKSENSVMWSEIDRLVIRIITIITVWTVTPPSAPIGERHVRYTGAIEDMVCSKCMN